MTQNYQLFKDGELVVSPSGWSVEGCADFVVDMAYSASHRSPGVFTVKRGAEVPIYTVENGKAVGREPVVDGDEVIGHL